MSAVPYSSVGSISGIQEDCQVSVRDTKLVIPQNLWILLGIYMTLFRHLNAINIILRYVLEITVIQLMSEMHVCFTCVTVRN